MDNSPATDASKIRSVCFFLSATDVFWAFFFFGLVGSCVFAFFLFFFKKGQLNNKCKRKPDIRVIKSRPYITASRRLVKIC